VEDIEPRDDHGSGELITKEQVGHPDTNLKLF
jgi:hypothetical protein